MSAAVEDMLRKACKRVAKLTEPDWKRFHLRGDDWGAVSKAMVKVLDELKGHGVSRPLSKLQELAFEQALKVTDRPLHTVSLWLTDSRIHLEQYLATKVSPHGEDIELRALMERRGLVRSKA